MLPLTVGIRDGAVHLVSTLGSAVYLPGWGRFGLSSTRTRPTACLGQRARRRVLDSSLAKEHSVAPCQTLTLSIRTGIGLVAPIHSWRFCTVGH